MVVAFIYIVAVHIESNARIGTYHVLTDHDRVKGGIKGGRANSIRRSNLGREYMKLIDFLTAEEISDLHGNYGAVLYFLLTAVKKSIIFIYSPPIFDLLIAFALPPLTQSSAVRT